VIRTPIRTLALPAAVVLGWLFCTSAPAFGQNNAIPEEGLFVGVPTPITSEVVQRIKNQVEPRVHTRPLKTVVFDFNPGDRSHSDNARHQRWLMLMDENRGKIDVAAGQRFLSDHFDTYTQKEEPSERTLCGHIDLSPRGMPTWQGPYAPVGAVQNKVTDAASAEKMTFYAALGHACGRDFKVASHLAQHSEYGWYKPILRDMDARPWTEFRAR